MPIDELQFQEIREDYERSYRELLKKVRKTFQSPEGQDVAWHLLSKAGIFQTTFRKNSEGAFLEGQRSMGLIILTLLGEADYKLLSEIMLKGFQELEEKQRGERGD